MTKNNNKFFYLANDTVFKYLFKNDKVRPFFEELIKYYTGLDISDFKFLDNELNTGNIYTDYRLDSLLTNKDESIILNVEMNREYNNYIDVRNRRYLHTIAGTSKDSKSYTDKKIVIQLNFNCYLSTDNENICTNTYMLKDDENDLVIDDFKIHNVFIPKEKDSCYNDSIKSKLKLFLCDSYSKMREVAKEDEELKIIVDEIEKLNKEKYFGALYNIKEEQKRLEISARSEGYNEGHLNGLKEGRDIGVQEGYSLSQKEIAKSLLEDGIDIEIVSKNTGLSVEELEKL